MAPTILVRSSLTTRVLYFTSLLVVGKLRWTMHSISSPYGERSIIPTPPACLLDNLSIYIFHWGYSSAPCLSQLVNSAMKSVTTCRLMALRGRYYMLNSLNSIAHSAIHLAALRLLIARCKSLSVKKTTVWSWKYALSLWATVTKAKASFSIGRYLSSAPRSARLA